MCLYEFYFLWWTFITFLLKKKKKKENQVDENNISFKQRAVFKLQGAPKSPEAFAERQIPVPLV